MKRLFLYKTDMLIYNESFWAGQEYDVPEEVWQRYNFALQKFLQAHEDLEEVLYTHAERARCYGIHE